jgi:hypothetical protein
MIICQKIGILRTYIAFFMGNIAAIRSRIIFVSNNDNDEPQMHLWIICELQIAIMEEGDAVKKVSYVGKAKGVFI